MIFAGLKQRLLQQGETETSFVYVIVNIDREIIDRQRQGERRCLKGDAPSNLLAQHGICFTQQDSRHEIAEYTSALPLFEAANRRNLQEDRGTKNMTLLGRW